MQPEKRNPINIFAGIFFLYISALILFYMRLRSFSGRRYFLLSEQLLFLIGAVVLFCIFFISRLLMKRKIGAVISGIAGKTVTIRIVFVLFFLLQFLICYSAYFETAWDVKMLLDNARILADTGTLASPDYFSRYPNNLLLLKTFSLIFKMFGAGAGLYVLLALTSLFNTLSGVFTFRVIRRLFGLGRAWLGLLFWAALVGTSPWILVPYSDSMSILLPVLIIDLWLQAKESDTSKRLFLYSVISLLATLAFRIKPQSFIVVIALILIQFPAAFRPMNKKDKALFITVPCLILILSFVLSGLWANHSFDLDKEKRFSFSHYLMMGSNIGHYGIYNEEDVAYSGSFDTAKERTKANLTVTKDRLFSMKGEIIRHVNHKLLICFHDGTFGWGGAGNFYYTIYPDKLPVISKTFHLLLYGQTYVESFTESVRECFWLLVLPLIAVGAFTCRKKEMAAVFLALLGLAAFLLLFEAGARYIYTNVPLFIVAAMSFKLSHKQV